MRVFFYSNKSKSIESASSNATVYMLLAYVNVVLRKVLQRTPYYIYGDIEEFQTSLHMLRDYIIVIRNVLPL